MRASVIGLGAFGTALANILASRSDDVLAWAREPKVVDSINVARENRASPPTPRFGPILYPTSTPTLNPVFVASPLTVVADVKVTVSCG